MDDKDQEIALVQFRYSFDRYNAGEVASFPKEKAAKLLKGTNPPGRLVLRPGFLERVVLKGDPTTDSEDMGTEVAIAEPAEDPDAPARRRGRKVK